MKAAAYRLGISAGTVRNHLAVARRRLCVDTTGQAVYLLALRGELRVDGLGR